MSESFERVKAQAVDLARKVDHDIQSIAGQSLKFTLLVWNDDNQSAADVRYAHISTLPGHLIPQLLRLVSDRFSGKTHRMFPEH